VQLYLDTSALVKRYDPYEVNAASVTELCDPAAANSLYTSGLTGPEVASALRRKEREGHLSADGVQRAWRAFQAHASTEYTLLAVIPDILREAERLILTRKLRAFDAVHLACALAVQTLLPEDTALEFATADRDQATAAESVGLKVRRV
jgi:predicted nucleic acid-binding protein